MSDSGYTTIVRDGFWSNNPGLVQLLGLCPLLATSTTVINGLGLGLATALTVTVTNLVVALIRDWVRPEIRIPVYVMVIAAVVTTIELLMNAWFHELYKVLGIFIPLIVTNCFVIGRAEAFASRNNVPRAIVDGLSNGLGFAAVLVCLGGLRELLGQGTLFANAHMMFGKGAEWMTVAVIPDYHGFLLAILPPGAFFGLALLIAIKNKIDKRQAARAAVPAEAATPSPA